MPPDSRRGGEVRWRSISMRYRVGETLDGWRETTSSPRFSAVTAEIRAAFEALVSTRPLLCRMSGSGSTLFAIYRSARDRDDATMMLGRKHGTLTPVETLATAAPGPEAI